MHLQKKYVFYFKETFLLQKFFLMSVNSSSLIIQSSTLCNAALACPAPLSFTTHTYSQPNPTPHHQPKTQQNLSLATYFSSIKKQIQNQELHNQQHTLKQVTTIFVNETQKETTSIIKVVIACINIICLILHSKKSLRKEIVRCVVNLRFMGSLLRFGAARIIGSNPGIQSSLCYLLQLCYEHRLFDCPKAKGLISLYKEFAFGLLENISNSPKVVFNSLRIVDYLQKSGLIETSDYIRYNIIKTIKKRTTTCKGDNTLVYELAFKLLLNSGNSQDAINLFRELSFSCRSSSSSKAFFKASSQSSRPLSSSSFNQILSEQLSQRCSQQQQQPLQQPFYRWIRRQIQEIEPLNLLRLLESGFVEMLSFQWIDVISRNCVGEVKEFVGALQAVQEKARELMLEETVKDKIMVLMPYLTYKDSEPREGMPSIPQF